MTSKPMIYIDHRRPIMMHGAFQYLKDERTKLVVKYFAERDVPATINTLTRLPADRINDIANIMRLLVSDEKSGVQWLGEVDLMRASPETARNYRKLLDDLFELAVFLDTWPDHPEFNLKIWNEYDRLSFCHVCESTRRCFLAERLHTPETAVIRHALHGSVKEFEERASKHSSEHFVSDDDLKRSIAEALKTEALLMSHMTGPYGKYAERCNVLFATSKDISNVRYFGGDLDRSRVLGMVVKSVFSSDELGTCSEFQICELPSAHVNASARIATNGTMVVEINRGLLAFVYECLNLWMAWLAGRADTPAPGNMRAPLRTLAERYVKQEHTPSRIQSPSDRSEGTPQDRADRTFRYCIVLCLEVFVICHELGHHLLNHTRRGRPTQQDEFDADARGLDLYERIFFRDSGFKSDPFLRGWIDFMAPQAKSAFDMLFSFIEVFEDLINCGTQDKSAPTHPRSSERRARLRAHFMKRNGHDSNFWVLAERIERYCAQQLKSNIS